MPRNDFINVDGTINYDNIASTNQVTSTSQNLINIMHPLSPLVGAKGDGIVDDATAIQAIINNDTNLDTIYFPNGTYYLGSTITAPIDEYGNCKLNFTFGNQVKFTGTGKMPTIMTNLGHQIYNNYYSKIVDSSYGNIAAVPITAEVATKNGFTGVAVGGLFGARGLGGSGQIWAINTITKLDTPYTDPLANGVGIEVDLDCYGRDLQGQGVLITGIGSKIPEVALVIQRAGGPSWNTGIEVFNSNTGILVNMIGAATPTNAMVLKGMSSNLLKIQPSDDTTPDNAVLYVSNAADSQVNFKLTKAGQVIANDGIQLGLGTKIKKHISVNAPVQTLTSLAANSTVEYDVVVTGVKIGDNVYCSTTSLQAGLIWSCYVIGTDDVRIRIANVTIGAIIPTPHQMVIDVFSHQ